MTETADEATQDQQRCCAVVSVHVKPQNHNARGEQWLWSSLGFIRKLSEEKKSVFGFLICFFKKNSGST